VTDAEPWEACRWIAADPAVDAVCITVVPTTDVEAVAAVYGCDPGSRREATLAEQLAMATPYPDGFGNDSVQLDRLGDAVVAVEANGWAGTEDPRPAELSHGGAYVAAFKNVNADMQVVVARDGRVVRRFDALLYDPEGALPEEAGLPFGEPGLAGAAMLALVERPTGVRLTREWVVDAPHPAFRRDPTD
jgi:hypothetical protein